MVLVDPHEPGTPGNQGCAIKWYDYVRFNNHSGGCDNYDLEFTGNHTQYNGKFGIFSTYQRVDRSAVINILGLETIVGIKGYKFTTNAKSVIQQYVNHTSIDNSVATIGLIEDAIKYLVN